MSDDDDGIPWEGEPCPTCGGQMNAEPVMSPEGIRVALVCPVDGSVSIADPFDAL